MKFDYVVGNPPFQLETENASVINGQNPRTNVFHYFQLEADKIAKESSVLIYPGGRWLHQSGKGLKQFGKDLINDVRLSTVEFYPDASEVFGNAAQLSDGVTIVVKKSKKTWDEFNYVYSCYGKRREIRVNSPGDDLLPLNPNDLSIVAKIRSFVREKHISFLHESILPRSLFGIESDFVEKHPDLVRPFSLSLSLSNNNISEYGPDEIKLLTNDKAGKAGRATWFITNRSVIKQNANFIDEFQVIVSSANAGGQKRDNQIEIVDNHSAFGRVRVALRSFKTLDEAKNFYDYANSLIIRYAFLMTDEALSSLGKLVPDIGNYHTENDYIVFHDNIDEQLAGLLGLTDDEYQYIQKVVNNVRRS